MDLKGRHSGPSAFHRLMIFAMSRSISRIGEDLPETMSGNRGLELLPWNLKLQLKAR